VGWSQNRSAPARRVGQKLEERCLVRDERTNEVRTACGEVEADRAAAAVAVDVRRLVADGPPEMQRSTGPEPRTST
jgi:hypothetical protein